MIVARRISMASRPMSKLAMGVLLVSAAPAPTVAASALHATPTYHVSLLQCYDMLEDGAALSWRVGPSGQHIELGIAETNLFLQLSALGLSSSMFGARLLPIGTVYDPFIRRGLDAMHYGCYQDSRFMLVATPSGITLAPEGGAHQSSETPLITLAQPGMAAFEPAYVDELAEIIRADHCTDNHHG